MRYLLGYLFIINLVSLIMYIIDKYAASRSFNRIRESYLLFSSFFGGFIGAFIGMILFRHKTRKKKFWLLNFIFMLIWFYLMYMFYRNG